MPDYSGSPPPGFMFPIANLAITEKVILRRGAYRGLRGREQ